MRNGIRFFAAPAALMIALALPLGAAAHGGKRGFGPGGPAMLFDEADADRDGKLTRAEFDAWREQHFAAVDQDGDGKLTGEELVAAANRRRAAARIERHDADGDGTLSMEEMAPRSERMFSRLDRDEDGVVTQEELSRHGKHGKRGKHGDGRRCHR